MVRSFVFFRALKKGNNSTVSSTDFNNQNSKNNRGSFDNKTIRTIKTKHAHTIYYMFGPLENVGNLIN